MTPITALSGRIGVLAAARILQWLARDEHSSATFDVPLLDHGHRADMVMDDAAATLALAVT